MRGRRYRQMSTKLDSNREKYDEILKIIENHKIKYKSQIFEDIKTNLYETELLQNKLVILYLQKDRYIIANKKQPHMPISIINNNDDYISFKSNYTDHFWTFFSFPSYRENVKKSIILAAKYIDISTKFVYINDITGYKTIQRRKIINDINENNKVSLEQSKELRSLSTSIKNMDIGISQSQNILIKLRNEADISLSIKPTDNKQILNVINEIRNKQISICTHKSYMNSRKSEIKLEKQKLQFKLGKYCNSNQKRIYPMLIYNNKYEFQQFIKKIANIHRKTLEYNLEVINDNIQSSETEMERLTTEFKVLDEQRYDIMKNVEYRRMYEYYQKQLKSLNIVA